MIGGEEADLAIVLGAGGETLTLSRPARLLIPDGADRTIAYLDGAGNPVVIDTPISMDSVLSAEADLSAAGENEGKIRVGGDAAVWTRHLTTFVSYGDGEDSGGGSIPDTVTLSVTGYDGETLLPPTAMTLRSGDTPLALLLRSGLSVSAPGGYVKTVEGLSEFDHGTGSGWMYSVNGEFLQTGAASYPLSAWDEVSWLYTTDLGEDIGGGYAPGIIPAAAARAECLEALEEALFALKEKSLLSDWELFALAAAGYAPDGANLDRILALVGEEKGEFRKPTDLARYILVIGALGGDPGNAAGYDLIEKLYRKDNLLMQGVNGPVFALIALNSGYYAVPSDALWTKEKLLSYILEAQNPDGGYSLAKGGESDADLTAMALQALAVYREREEAAAARRPGPRLLERKPAVKRRLCL